jgi:hypothetical protein
MVTDLFELNGWDTYYLGTRLPAKAILAAVAARGAHVLAPLRHHPRAPSGHAPADPRPPQQPWDRDHHRARRRRRLQRPWLLARGRSGRVRQRRLDRRTPGQPDLRAAGRRGTHDQPPHPPLRPRRPRPRGAPQDPRHRAAVAGRRPHRAHRRERTHQAHGLPGGAPQGRLRRGLGAPHAQRRRPSLPRRRPDRRSPPHLRDHAGERPHRDHQGARPAEQRAEQRAPSRDQRDLRAVPSHHRSRPRDDAPQQRPHHHPARAHPARTTPSSA